MSVIIIFLESFLNFSAVFQVSAGGQAGGSIGETLGFASKQPRGAALPNREAIGWSRLPTTTADFI